MPVPTPRKGEEEGEYISRCIQTLQHSDPRRPDEQIAAMCYGQWRGESLHPDFQRILRTFVNHFSDGTGLDRFIKFIGDNSLNVASAYHPMSQFNESFQWAEPLIQYYKKDKEAKYYLIRALTANISMNNNDYSDYEKIMQAAPSLKVKPVDINHDHSKTVSFPRTRVDMTDSEDLALELSLRVDNEDAWLQQALDTGAIIHPSIEGYKHADGHIEFTGLALLEKGVQLPGDPLTEIVPLILNESVRSQFCKIVDGNLICKCGVINEKRKNKIMSEQEDPTNKQAFIDTCTEGGKTREECEELWSREQEQMELSPPETTEEEDEKKAFMDECTAGGKTMEDCEALWQHKLGATTPPATNIPEVGEPPTTSMPDVGLDKDLQLAPVVEQEQPARVPAKPTPETEYPTDSEEAFMQACLSANAGDTEYCTTLWKQIKGEQPEEPWRADVAAGPTEQMLRLSETNIRLQSELAAKAKHEIELLNENAKLRENLSSTSKWKILLDAERDHTKLLKDQNKKLNEHINSIKNALSSTKDGKATALKEYIDKNRRLERKIEDRDLEIREQQENIDKLSIQGARLRKDVADLTESSMASNERTRGAVKEKSMSQLENANLRDEAARLTRKISELTEKRSLDAKRIYDVEQQSLKLQEKLSKTVIGDKELRKQMKAIQSRNKRIWKELNKRGFYLQNEEGKLITGSGV